MRKEIVILGAGKSGVGAAILAKKEGYEVFVSDASIIKDEYKESLINLGIAWEENTHSLNKILEASEVIKSPGIPDKAEAIQKIKEANIPIISEIEFASRYTNAKIIAITGSNGKTTTTLLTYHMLKKANLNVGLAGNVGSSFAKQVAENNFDYYVIELSSFQLDNIENFKADIAILLNITPDHLDRYNYNFQEYIDSKFRITMNQSENDYFIYCQDDESITKQLESKNIKAQKLPFSHNQKVENGAYIQDEELIINWKNNNMSISIMEIALNGRHNRYNSMAAGIGGRVLELRKDIIKQSLSDFQNIEHRLEFVATIHGIEFVNDSKATNVNAAWYALESFHQPIVWIAGGVDKGNDYSELLPLVKEKVKAIICLGKENEKLHQAFDGVVNEIVDAKSAKEAVSHSYRIAKKGDIVLLSPACASFDLFSNYEDRGFQFKKEVRAL